MKKAKAIFYISIVIATIFGCNLSIEKENQKQIAKSKSLEAFKVERDSSDREYKHFSDSIREDYHRWHKQYFEYLDKALSFQAKGKALMQERSNLNAVMDYCERTGDIEGYNSMVPKYNSYRSRINTCVDSQNKYFNLAQTLK